MDSFCPVRVHELSQGTGGGGIYVQESSMLRPSAESTHLVATLLSAIVLPLMVRVEVVGSIYDIIGL